MRLAFALAAVSLLAACVPAGQHNGNASSSSVASASGSAVSSAAPALSPQRQAKFDAMLKANSSRAKTVKEGMPFGVYEKYRAELQSSFPGVKGMAIIAESRRDTVIRFENFWVPFFPDLIVSVAADAKGTDAVEFLPLRGNNGLANHTKRGRIDFAQKPYVLIQSKEYGVVFAYAKVTK